MIKKNKKTQNISLAKSAIEHYDAWAAKGDWDKGAKEHSWLSPDVIFGLVFEYTKPGQKILDVGCGTGFSSEHFAKIGLEVYGIDGSKSMIEEFRKKNFAKDLKMVDLNEDEYPYPDNFFDQVTANGVFYFFSNLEPLIKESFRVLQESGIFSFNIEELRGNEKNKYINIDNALVSKDVLQKTGVKVYRHDFDQVADILRKYNFEILKTLNYHAYKSPSTGKDVYFTAFVARKLKT